MTRVERAREWKTRIKKEKSQEKKEEISLTIVI
jgi:hypothetical protein